MDVYAPEVKRPKKETVCASERNCHVVNESAKRQETRKKKVVSESVEYICIHIT